MRHTYSYRHCAVNIKTGTIISCQSGQHLKRVLASRRYGAGPWRFCHDFGKKWAEQGLPTR